MRARGCLKLAFVATAAVAVSDVLCSNGVVGVVSDVPCVVGIS